MNCHGTALGLAGNFLDAVPVTRWRTVPAYEAQCGLLTHARYDDARDDRPYPPIGELSLSHGAATWSGWGTELCLPTPIGGASTPAAC